MHSYKDRLSGYFAVYPTNHTACESSFNGVHVLVHDAFSPTGHELRRNIALALTALFVITLLMLCDMRLCFMVFLCVVFTMVDVIGIISWWDVQIDVVSATYLVLVVGLCVDYSTHIAHAFKVNRGKSDGYV